MSIDFSLLFVIAAAITGVIWALDAWLLAPRRAASGEAAEKAPKEPVIVEYSRAFFPIIVIVLLFRSFLYEPFRIPSGSMMPTLLQGDFILVNKFAYGLRLPVINTKFLGIGEPFRGDVVVFRLPADPSTHFIKRVVGLPGDVVEYRNKQLYINGELIEITPNGIYHGEVQQGDRVYNETLGDVNHQILISSVRPPWSDNFKFVVPDGEYFMMGDNRDHSRDSRFPQVGPIPEENLVGRAERIWMNIGGEWGRIGDRIN